MLRKVTTKYTFSYNWKVVNRVYIHMIVICDVKREDNKIRRRNSNLGNKRRPKLVVFLRPERRLLTRGIDNV